MLHSEFIRATHSSEQFRLEALRAARQAPCQIMYREGDFALRLHQATRLHFDVRFDLLGSLLSYFGEIAPSLDPCLSMPLTLTGDHNRQHLFNEYVIPANLSGAGPTMPVSHGRYRVIPQPEEGLEANMLVQLAFGRVVLRLDSAHLTGLWKLTGKDTSWELRKLPDEYASATTRLILNRSSLSGKTLDEIRTTRGAKPTESAQIGFDFRVCA